MNCPRCQNPLPDSPTEACPHCGQNLAALPASPPAKPINWLLFFALLLGPPALCLLFLGLGVAIFAGMVGALGALCGGLICTGMIVGQFKISGATKALAWFFIGILLCGLSFFLTVLGCTSALHF